jgi:hypothetical protein
LTDNADIPKRVETQSQQMSPLKRSAWIATFLLVGCAVEEAHWDEARLREHAIAYYTDQIMDNLIRAKNGQFFLHVNINNLQALVTSEVAGSVGGGDTTTNTRNRQITNQTTTTTNAAGQAVAVVGGAVSTITRMAMSPFTYSVTPKRSDQLTFAAVPEINDQPIYRAYLQFLNVTDKEESLAEMEDDYDLVTGDDVKSVLKKKAGETLVAGDPDPNKRQPKNAVYYVPGTLKRWNGDVYYVPIEFKDQYFQLCVAISGRIALPAKGTVSYTGGTPPGQKKPADSGEEKSLESTAKATPTPAKPKRKAHFLPDKHESQEQNQLKILEQKLNSLTPPQ